ncbi:MAG: hypothetical protein D3909_09905, partial [Candidatus Electrothrix sp. ATG1]|nr:hypothetical protein [Candidatus Electrothrix sp. ATG1]
MQKQPESKQIKKHCVNFANSVPLRTIQKRKSLSQLKDTKMTITRLYRRIDATRAYCFNIESTRDLNE